MKVIIWGVVVVAVVWLVWFEPSGPPQDLVDYLEGDHRIVEAMPQKLDPGSGPGAWEKYFSDPKTYRKPNYNVNTGSGMATSVTAVSGIE